MSFLAPLMLLGLLGAAVPIAIHLIGRRRAPVKRFGAIDFLFGERRRVARRLRLRELLLLGVRILACLAIPLALAKPFVSCAARGPTIQRGPQAVVLVIDNSFPMGYRRGGGTLFAVARERARRVLDELGPEADVAVAFAAEGAEAPVDLSRDHLKLRDAIEDAPLSMRPADTTRTLRAAAQLLHGSPHAARRIYLFTPLAAAAFPPGEAPWTAAGAPELHVVDVSDGAPLPNLAVIGARAEKDPDLGARGVRITAQLANYGLEPVKDRSVTLRIGARAVARGLVALGPGEITAKRFAVTLPAEARASEVVIELDDDALPADDRRWLHVELTREVRVLVVDGDPRTVRHDDEAFYLETALRPGDRADSALAVAVTTPDDLPRRRLADHDVIVLANVKPLEESRVRDLEAWVRKGGGLVVAVGDHVDADAYNQAMGGLLAQELRTPRVAPGASRDEQCRRGERIGRFEAAHPIFSVFPDRAVALREACFWKIYLVGPSARVENRRTLARFAGGAPALVEARVGAGRLLLFTSSLDRDWTDFPIHPGYLPFVQQIARYLSRAPTRETAQDLVIGRTRTLEVAPEDKRVEVAAPSGKKTAFEGARLAGRTGVPFDATDEPGFYHVTAVAGDGGVPRPRPGSDFVVNLDPRGSDTRRAAPDALPGPAPASALAAGAPGAARRRVELWHALAASLLLFLLSEALLTRRG